jgi:hypothetical protein
MGQEKKKKKKRTTELRHSYLFKLSVHARP